MKYNHTTFAFDTLLHYLTFADLKVIKKSFRNRGYNSPILEKCQYSIYYPKHSILSPSYIVAISFKGYRDPHLCTYYRAGTNKTVIWSNEGVL